MLFWDDNYNFYSNVLCLIAVLRPSCLDPFFMSRRKAMSIMKEKVVLVQGQI